MTTWESHLAKYDNCQTPSAEVKINKMKFSIKELTLAKINVDMSVNGEISTCCIEYRGDAELARQGVLAGPYNFKLPSDISKIKVGANLDVCLGYKISLLGKNVDSFLPTFYPNPANPATTFSGYIYNLDCSIDKNTNRIVVKVYGMDGKLLMVPSNKTVLFKAKKKYSDIVSAIFQDYGIMLPINKQVKIEGEKAFKVPIYQYNESDYDFLRRIARNSGSLFFVSAGKFCFISPSVNKATKLKIPAVGIGITRVDFSENIFGQPKKVVVSTTDPKNFSQKIYKAVNSLNPTINKLGKLSSKLAQLGSNGEIDILDNVVSAKDEAGYIAQSIFNRISLFAANAKVCLYGMQDIRLSEGVTLDGYGKPADNDYIVTAINHEWNFVTMKTSTILTLGGQKINT